MRLMDFPPVNTYILTSNIWFRTIESRVQTLCTLCNVQENVNWTERQILRSVYTFRLRSCDRQSLSIIVLMVTGSQPILLVIH